MASQDTAKEIEALKQRAEEAERKLKEMESILSKAGSSNSNDDTTVTTGDDNKNNGDDAKQHELTTDAIVTRLSNKDYQYYDTIVKLLGEAKDKNGKSQWKCVECGDGNINYIFILESDFAKKNSTTVVIKQAPPYIRLVGPVWPLKQTRCDYEVGYTQMLSKLCNDEADNKESGSKKDKNDKKESQFSKLGLGFNNAAPEIYFYDNKNYLFCMENLSNCQIFRTQLAAKNKDIIEFKLLGKHIGYFLGNILFKTSDLYLSADDKVELMSKYMKNTEMMGITELVIFEEPYIEADNNKRKIGDDSSGDGSKLTGILASIFKLRQDKRVLTKIYAIRELFRNKRESLLHGDLHTGSLMVNEKRTVAIDAEFSFYGPMAYDIGQLIGNMALGVFAQPIYNKLYGEDRSKYQKYVTDQIIDVWNTFEAKFLDLWSSSENGNLFPKSMRKGNDFGEEYKKSFLKRIYNESLDFAASVMIRRCIGIADAPEYRVKDEKMREICEDRSIRFAHQVLVRDSKSFDKIEQFGQSLLKFE